MITLKLNAENLIFVLQSEHEGSFTDEQIQDIYTHMEDRDNVDGWTVDDIAKGYLATNYQQAASDYDIEIEYDSEMDKQDKIAHLKETVVTVMSDKSVLVAEYDDSVLLSVDN